MKCERCGEVFHSEGHGFIAIQVRHDINEPLKDVCLCTDCENDIYEYLKEKVER